MGFDFTDAADIADDEPFNESGDDVSLLDLVRFLARPRLSIRNPGDPEILIAGPKSPAPKAGERFMGDFNAANMEAAFFAAAAVLLAFYEFGGMSALAAPVEAPADDNADAAILISLLDADTALPALLSHADTLTVQATDTTAASLSSDGSKDLPVPPIPPARGSGWTPATETPPAPPIVEKAPAPLEMSPLPSLSVPTIDAATPSAGLAPRHQAHVNPAPAPAAPVAPVEPVVPPAPVVPTPPAPVVPTPPAPVPPVPVPPTPTPPVPVPPAPDTIAVVQSGDQSYLADHAISLTLPANTFTDRLGETLTLTATLSDGSALPLWMAFDAATRTFTGTTPDNAGVIAVTVTATDTDGATASDAFDITTIAAPTLTDATADQSVTANEGFSLPLPPDAFTDPQGQALTLTATLADGSALPSWLTFNPATRTFTGTALTALGAIGVRVTATDTSGLSASETFQVVTAASVPVDELQTADQTLTADQGFTFMLAAGTFADPQGESLTLTATQSNDQPLPSWLTFNQSNGTFSGFAPDSVQNVNITVTATDTSGLSASETFRVNVIAPPVVTDPTPTETTLQGQAFSFTLPADTFTDPNGSGLTYTASLGNGVPLPSWLHFNASTLTFSGVGPNDLMGAFVTLTATDGLGLSASETFQVRSFVDPVASLPYDNVISDAGVFQSVQLLPGHIFDPNTETLTFTVTQANGDPLPAWLTWDATTQTLAGTPPTGAELLDLRVTGTDTSGLSASETFDWQVIGAPTLTSQTANQIVLSGNMLDVDVSGAFADPQGETLTYSASGLPAWLAFNTATDTFSGTATNTAATNTITVTATNSSGLSDTETFNVTSIATPMLTDATGGQVLTATKSFTFTLPADSLTDPNGQGLTYTATTATGAALPSWLNFDAATLTFSGVALATPGSFGVRVTATDTSGLSASEIFNVTTAASAPVQDMQTADQSVTANESFSFTVAAGTFVDPQGEGLTYTATIGGDFSPLPSWLHFDAATLTFSGTAPVGTGPLGLIVTATDTSGLSTSEWFTVNTVAAPPVIQSQTADQTVLSGNTLGVDVSGVFVDPQGEAMTYTATLADGSALPAWLAFDATTLTFSGTAPGTAGEYSVVITATDTSGLSTNETFNVTTIAAPSPTDPMADQYITANESFSFALPPDAFADPNGETLTYTATMADGSALPGWLHFDAATGTFSGTALTALDTIGVRVTATDTSGLMAYQTFTVATTATAPVEEIPTANQDVTANETFSFTLPDGTFTDPQGEAMTYTATLADGSALPPWLTFDAATLTFSGTAPYTLGSIGVRVTATDASGMWANETFAVATVATAPVEEIPTADQDVIANQDFTFSVAGAFADPQGEVLTYRATDLPSWLIFDAATQTFSGTAPASAGTVSVTVTASDSSGLSSSETFSVRTLAPPTENSQVADQDLTGNQTFSLTVGGTFADPNGEALTYTATLADGSALPSWLTFDAATDTFTGTVPNDNEDFTVLLTATDSSGLSNTETFLIGVVPAQQSMTFTDDFISASAADPSLLTVTPGSLTAMRLSGLTMGPTVLNLSGGAGEIDGVAVHLLTGINSVDASGSYASVTLTGLTGGDTSITGGDTVNTITVFGGNNTVTTSGMSWNTITTNASTGDNTITVSMGATATIYSNANDMIYDGGNTTIYGGSGNMTVTTTMGASNLTATVGSGNASFDVSQVSGSVAITTAGSGSATITDNNVYARTANLTDDGTGAISYTGTPFTVTMGGFMGMMFTERTTLNLTGNGTGYATVVANTDNVNLTSSGWNFSLTMGDGFGSVTGGTSGLDTVFGGSGTLGFWGNGDAANIYGGTGATFITENGGGALDFVGGTGASNVTTNAAGTATLNYTADLSYTPEDVYSYGQDTIYGGSGNLYLTLNAGATDYVHGGNGTATVTDNGGTLHYDDGANTGTATINVGDGTNSTLFLGNGSVSINLALDGGTTTITGYNAADTIDGGATALSTALDGNGGTMLTFAGDTYVDLTDVAYAAPGPQSMDFTDGFVTASAADPALLTVTPGTQTTMLLDGLTDGATALSLDGGAGQIDGVDVNLLTGINSVDATGTTADVNIIGNAAGGDTLTGGSGTNEFTTKGTGNTINGGDGSVDTISSSGSGDTINEINDSQSTITTNGTGDTINLGGGTDSITAIFGATVYGGSGSMSFMGLFGEDDIHAGDATVDYGTYGSNNLNFYADNGTSTLTLGSGQANLFLNFNDSAMLTVSDFNPANGSITLLADPNGDGSTGDVMAFDDGNGGTDLMMGGNMVDLLGVSGFSASQVNVFAHS